MNIYENNLAHWDILGSSDGLFDAKHLLERMLI